ncbi:MAG: zinc metallopeptidase, partial [Clostridia bacterium]|nr:zinc metallopeptidase [Clostridia bacterium]
VRLRSGMAGIVNIGSYLGIILAVIGSLFAGELGETLIQIGLLLYSTVFLFTLVTLPVEINASRRAISAVRSSGLFTESETAGMKKVLTAAALTYVAAMASALLNLLRMIYIFGGRRRS